MQSRNILADNGMGCLKVTGERNGWNREIVGLGILRDWILYFYYGDFFISESRAFYNFFALPAMLINEFIFDIIMTWKYLDPQCESAFKWYIFLEDTYELLKIQCHFFVLFYKNLSQNIFGKNRKIELTQCIKNVISAMITKATESFWILV